MKNRILITMGLLGASVFVVTGLAACRNSANNKSTEGTSQTVRVTASEEMSFTYGESNSQNITTDGTAVEMTKPSITTADNSEKTEPETEKHTGEDNAGTTESIPAETTGETVSTNAGETTKETVKETETDTDSESTKESSPEKDTTTEETTDANDSNIVIGNNGEEVSFAFRKIRIDNDKFDYYGYMIKNGYIEITGEQDLSKLCVDMLNNLENGRQGIKYIVTDKGYFDEISSEMDILKQNLEQKFTPGNRYKKESYLFSKLSMSYQYYYARGIALFEIRKIQDVVNTKCNNSVYAVYYYSYSTKEQNALADTAVNNFLNKLTGTEIDKIHDTYRYLIERVKYSAEPENILSHSSYAALVLRTAVCDGYARAFKLIMDKAGIGCRIVYSKGHAWNEVLYDGKWYMVDTTFGAQTKDDKFFMLGRDVLSTTEKKKVNGYVYNTGELDEYGYALDSDNRRGVSQQSMIFPPENKKAN